MADRADLLDSWKEISEHLKRDIRTCQRYERELGLPVHRLDSSPKARVFAFKDEIDAWLARKGDEGRRIGRRRRLRLILAGATMAGAIAFLILPNPIPRGDGPPVLPSGRPSVAVLSLSNRTGRPDHEPLRGVLASMIGLDLSQSRYLYVVPEEQIHGVMRRLGLLDAAAFSGQDLRAIGRRAVVRFVAMGYFAKAGERYLVQMRVQEAESGRLLGTLESSCTGIDGIFSLVDEITPKLKLFLEISAIEIANDIDSPLDRVTTSSAEAYEHYVRGMKLAGATDFAAAVTHYKKAVSIDPGFAMAYRGLAAAYSNLGMGAETRKYSAMAEEAMDRQDRLPLREKLLIGARSAATPEEAVEKLTRLLELYPEDVPGNVNLGWIYANEMGELEKAAERYSIPVRNRVERFIPYINLHSVYCQLGAYQEAEEVLFGYIRDFPGNASVAEAYRLLAHVHMTEGRFARALKDMRGSSRSVGYDEKEAARTRAMIWTLAGRFDEAERELDGLLSGDNQDLRLRAHEDLARLCRTRGMFRRAWENMEKASTLARTNGLAVHAGTLAMETVEGRLAAGDADGAESTLAEYRSWLKKIGRDPDTDDICLISEANILASRGAFDRIEGEAGRYAPIFATRPSISRIYPLWLWGLMALARDEYGKAVLYLEQAKQLAGHQLDFGIKWPFLGPHAYVMEQLASTYWRSGDLERARREFEAISRLTTGRLAYGEIYARSFYMLGQIYEQMGMKRPARAHYRKFLGLWKDADPGRPEVEHAKARLAA